MPQQQMQQQQMQQQTTKMTNNKCNNNKCINNNAATTNAATVSFDFNIDPVKKTNKTQQTMYNEQNDVETEDSTIFRQKN
jgi:hypothetical protein